MDTFNALGYLEQRFVDVNDQRVSYILVQLHEAVQAYVKKQKRDGELKVLDFGSGPVVQNTISVAKHASEMSFATFPPPIERPFRNGWTETPTLSTGLLISTTSSRLSRERARRRPGRGSSERERSQKSFSVMLFRKHPWRKATKGRTMLSCSVHVLKVLVAIWKVA